jgi:hypothetical protein
MTPAHDFIIVGEGTYRVEVPDLNLTLQVDRLRRRGDELVGELIVMSDLAGSLRITDEGIISAADFNLSSVRARQDRATLLGKRAQTQGQHDWYATLEYLCHRVIQAERTGAPSVLLADVPQPEPDRTWAWHGLPIPQQDPMIWFGDGGTGKSLLALALAGELAARGVPTLYVDWETTAAEHRDRLGKLYNRTLPPVRYIRASWPLSHEVDRLRHAILAHDIAFVVLDSVAFGCDGPPEAADAAARYFQAVRQLQTGALLIAHVTKAENGDRRPFGSAFWHNGARSTWNVKRDEADGCTQEMVLALYHRKVNNGPLLSPRGLRLRFSTDRIIIDPADLAQSADFAATLPIWQRARGTLRHGPMTLAAIAEELGSPVNSVEHAVRRHPKLFTRVSGKDGIARIALLERDAA